MVEHFLEEQLARIRKLTADLEEMTKRAAVLSQELARSRASVNRSPLDDVRDYRVYWSATSLDHASESASKSDSPEHRDP